MENVSFKIDQITKEKIEKFYSDFKQTNNGEYIAFFAKNEDVTVTIYESKKGYKALFTGKKALEEAKLFNSEAEVLKPKEKVEEGYLDFGMQIGSDEVGFGDFFGPLVVVGCYYDSSLANILDNIHDSKKLNDTFILDFVPKIINQVSFSKLTVHNDKYNQMISQGYNMNEMKSMLHNQVLFNLAKKHPMNKNFYIDQFCEPDTYFRYLAFKDEKVTNITFRTKGESHYPSVALASMIARYCFLKEMDVLSLKYGMDFPKGASKKVDEFTQVFIKKYSKEELMNVAKTNFANYKSLE